MITIKNTQRSIAVDIKKLRHDAEQILHLLDYNDFDLGIWLTSTTTIRLYNKTYRHKDKTTDILSFAYHPQLKPKRISIKNPDDKNLGDLLMAPAYIKKKAQQLGVPFDQQLRRILVHGICHLLGYDHEKEEDYKIMHKKEQFLLHQLKKLSITW